MIRKILITIRHDDVASRFDLAPEVLIALVDESGSITDKKTLILPSVSAEALCQLIIAENTDLVVCGGIESEYFEYLNWKKINVIDSVIGPYETALEVAASGRLEQGAILFDRDIS